MGSLDYEMGPKFELQREALNGYGLTYLGLSASGPLLGGAIPMLEVMTASANPDGQHIGNQHSTSNGAFLNNICPQLPVQSCCQGKSMGRQEEGLWEKLLVREGKPLGTRF